MNKFAVLVAVVLMGSLVFAAEGLNPVTAGNPIHTVAGAVNDLCYGLKSMLPIAGMLAIVLAGVIYAAGQMMGAETRARANVWATACLTGALIAIMMAVVAPAVLSTIYGTAWPTDLCKNSIS